MLCGFSSLWWPFGWNCSYLGFLGIIWRMCGSKWRGEGGGIFPMLCVECCLVLSMFFSCFFKCTSKKTLKLYITGTKVTKLWFICLEHLDTLRQRQNGRHFPDDIFKRVLVSENVGNSIKISLKQATSHCLNQCWPRSLKHICGPRGTWVNPFRPGDVYNHQWSRSSLNQTTAYQIFNFKFLSELILICYQWQP